MRYSLRTLLARDLRLALAFFVLTVLCVPGIAGAGTTPRWAFAAVVLPLLVPSRQTEFTSAHAFGLLFIWYAAVSISWSHYYDGLDALIKLIVVAEAFWLGSKLDSLKPVIIGMGLGIWVNSAVMLLGLDVPHVNDNAGLFINSNVMGEIAGLALVAAVAYRLWWLVPGILPAFIMANCRGAFVAVAGAFVIWLWGKSRLAASVLAIVGIVGVAVVMGDSPSAAQRITMLVDTIPYLTIMGHGIGSFYTLFPLYSTSIDSLAMRPEHLHNDWLEFVFETGAGTVFLFAVLWISRSILLAVVFIEALFGFPLHMPATAVLGGLIAGHAVRDRHSLRYDLAAWRISLRAWSQRARSRFGYRRVEGGGDSIPA